MKGCSWKGEKTCLEVTNVPGTVRTSTDFKIKSVPGKVTQFLLEMKGIGKTFSPANTLVYPSFRKQKFNSSSVRSTSIPDNPAVPTLGTREADLTK